MTPAPAAPHCATTPPAVQPAVAKGSGRLQGTPDKHTLSIHSTHTQQVRLCAAVPSTATTKTSLSAVQVALCCTPALQRKQLLHLVALCFVMMQHH